MKASRNYDAPDAMMSAAIHTLGVRNSALLNVKGLAFWPVPALFPAVLANCIAGLQEHISGEYIHNPRTAHVLGNVRCLMLRIVGHGDLGEDHAALFLRDHPGIARVAPEIADCLPFSAFCRGLHAIEDPVMQLGALMRNEQGSISEIDALVRTGLIAHGPYSEAHAVEELEHAATADEVRRLLYVHTEYAQRYRAGETLHDRLYAEVATWSPSDEVARLMRQAEAHG